MKSIGIDIGSYSIKIVEIEIHSTYFNVVHCEEFPINQDINLDKRLEIIEILRQYIARHDPIQTRITTAISQEHVSTRYKVLPFKERIKILKGIAFELEDEVPFDQEDAIFDAKILNFNEQSCEVLAIACPKKYIEESLQLYRDSGFDPDIITMESIGIANLVEHWLHIPDVKKINTDVQNLSLGRVFVNIGHNRSQIIVFRGSAIIEARSLFWGGNDVAQAILKKYSITYVDAIKALCAKGFVLTNVSGSNRDQEVFSQTIVEALKPLILDLRLTLLQAQSEFRITIEQIDLTGGLSLIRNLPPLMTQHLAIRTNYLDKIDPHNLLNFKIELPIAQNAVALGLAIEGCRRGRNPAVNLRKESFGKQSETLHRLWKKWEHTARIVAVATIVLFIYSFLRENFATQLNEKGSEVLKDVAKNNAHLSGNKATPNKIRAYIKDKKQEIKSQELLEKAKNITSALDVLNRISSAIPESKKVSLNLKHIQIHEETVSIEGQVSNAQQLATLEQSLKGLSVDGKIQNNKVTDKSKKTDFSIQFKVARQNDRGGA